MDRYDLTFWTQEQETHCRTEAATCVFVSLHHVFSSDHRLPEKWVFYIPRKKTFETKLWREIDICWNSERWRTWNGVGGGSRWTYSATASECEQDYFCHWHILCSSEVTLFVEFPYYELRTRSNKLCCQSDTFGQSLVYSCLQKK